VRFFKGIATDGPRRHRIWIMPFNETAHRKGEAT